MATTVTRTEKLIASATEQTQRYTDEMISDLKTQMDEYVKGRDMHDKQVHNRRLLNHLICLTIGMIITIISVKLEWNPAIAPSVITVPSFILEAIDRIKLL